MIIHCIQPQKPAYQHYLPVCLKKADRHISKTGGFFIRENYF